MKSPNEYFFELAPAFCEQCSMFQIVEQPRPDKMFHEQLCVLFEHLALHASAFRGIRQGVIGGHPRRTAAIHSSSNSAAMTASCCAIFMSAACAISASSRR